MALLDDINTTGFYSEQIAVTSGNGFEAGKNYCVRITGVVSGVTGVELHTFTVQTRATDDLAYPATSGRSMIVDTNGATDANLVRILGTLLTEALGGYLAAAFKKLFDVAVPVFTSASVNQTSDAGAKLGTPIALDGSAATVAGMLTKMADDNGGADFDATTDSLTEIRAQVDTLVPGAPIQLNADITEIHTS